MTDSFIPVSGTDKKLQTYENTVGGELVHSEAVTPTDQTGAPFTASNRFPVDAPLPSGAATAANQQTNALTDAQLRATAVPVSNATLPNLVGTFNYVSGTMSGAGNKTGVGRCIGIRVFASAADGSFNINGGDTITVRDGTGVDVNPGAQVTAPVVNWVSGTIDVLIVGLT